MSVPSICHVQVWCLNASTSSALDHALLVKIRDTQSFIDFKSKGHSPTRCLDLGTAVSLSRVITGHAQLRHLVARRLGRGYRPKIPGLHLRECPILPSRRAVDR